MARTEPATKRALMPQRYATQVRTEAYNDQPLGFFNAFGVGLRVDEFAELYVSGSVYFGLRPTANEDWLSAPLDGDNLTFVDGAQVDISRRRI
jgi:hypothetical protein